MSVGDAESRRTSSRLRLVRVRAMSLLYTASDLLFFGWFLGYGDAAYTRSTFSRGVYSQYILSRCILAVHSLFLCALCCHAQVIKFKLRTEGVAMVLDITGEKQPISVTQMDVIRVSKRQRFC